MSTVSEKDSVRGPRRSGLPFDREGSVWYDLSETRSLAPQVLLGKVRAEGSVV